MLGFIIFGIIDNCGGVPTDDRGYIGFRYWNGENDNFAFRNGKSFPTQSESIAFAFHTMLINLRFPGLLFRLCLRRVRFWG